MSGFGSLYVWAVCVGMAGVIGLGVWSSHAETQAWKRSEQAAEDEVRRQKTWNAYTAEEAGRIETYIQSHPHFEIIPRALAGNRTTEKAYFFRTLEPAVFKRQALQRPRVEDPFCPFELRIMRFHGLTPEEVAKTVANLLKGRGYELVSINSMAPTWFNVERNEGNPEKIDISRTYDDSGDVLVHYERRVSEEEEKEIEKSLGFPAFRKSPGIQQLDELCPHVTASQG